MVSRNVVCLSVMLALAGCAVTPQQFAQRRNTMSDADVCQAEKSARQSGDRDYIVMVGEERNRRGLGVERCNALIAQAEQGAAIAAAAMVGIAALAVASSQNGAQAPAGRSEYAWVRSYNEQRRPVLVCKEIKTGKVEEAYHCKNQPRPGRD